MNNSNYIPRNMLVTGAAGFIGSNFVHFILLCNKAIKIINLDKLTYAGNKENLSGLPAADAARHQLIVGDICDRALVDKLLREHAIDTIVHFAAESHVDRSITGPAAFIETNIVGTFTLLEAARKYWTEEKKLDRTQCRFHHISTDEVYGELGVHDPAFTETTPYAPSSPYSASKASSDHLVRAYFRTYGLPITLSNCSNNYGPRQHNEKLIPTVIRCCAEQRPIPVYGNGSNVRDWLYVDDHCAAIAAILHAGTAGETYNVGGNCERDNLSLVKAICTLMDEIHPRAQGKSHEELITFVTDRPGHDWRYAIDNHKICSTLNWQPSYALEDGLRATIEYYLAR